MGNVNTERHVTVIVYLGDDTGNDSPGYGETVFPKLGVSVEPRCGRALIFKNLDRKMRCRKDTIHEGSPLLGNVVGGGAK